MGNRVLHPPTSPTRRESSNGYPVVIENLVSFSLPVAGRRELTAGPELLSFHREDSRCLCGLWADNQSRRPFRITHQGRDSLRARDLSYRPHQF